MKTVACIIARTNSTRLPKKVLKKINGKSLVEHIVERVKKVKSVDEIYICTSNNPQDEILLKIAYNNKIKSYAGSEESVIDRMLDVGEIEKADNLIRITADNIFTDSVYLEIMIQEHIKNQVDYTRTEFLPLGITAEVIKHDALKKCYKYLNPFESQYMGIYLYDPNRFKCLVLSPLERHSKSKFTFTIDTPEDWKRTERIFELTNGFISLDDLILLADKNLIDDFVYKSTRSVKFPCNLLLSFSTYRNEMEVRYNKSQKINITRETYEVVFDEQNKTV